MQNDNISLYYKDARSDKEYHVQLEAEGNGYVVKFQYGRRGSSLQSGTKTPSPVPYAKAKKVYDGIVTEKLGKSYEPDISAKSSGVTSITQEERFTGVLPQLLNAVDQDQAGAYLDDLQWVMQRKFDGKRMMVRVGAQDDPIIGINRKGQAVGLSKSASEELYGLNKHHFVLDAESIGDRLYVFDLLEYRRGNIRDLPFSTRYRFLTEALASVTPGGSVEIAPLYTNSQDKHRAFEELKAAGAEGVVFKLADSRYVPGRPASGGDALKVKFWQTASVLVEAITDGKRSVAMAVLDDKGLMVNVGSVTIPPNQPIPNPGAILDVRYLYAYEGGGSLFQPTSLRVRDDIDRTDCLQSQLVYKTAADFEEDTSPTLG